MDLLRAVNCPSQPALYYKKCWRNNIVLWSGLEVLASYWLQLWLGCEHLWPVSNCKIHRFFLCLILLWISSSVLEQHGSSSWTAELIQREICHRTYCLCTFSLHMPFPCHKSFVLPETFVNFASWFGANKHTSWFSGLVMPWLARFHWLPEHLVLREYAFYQFKSD
jgi:hypothetical protein